VQTEIIYYNSISKNLFIPLPNESEKWEGWELLK
jgi:hypothetical protein